MSGLLVRQRESICTPPRSPIARPAARASSSRGRMPAENTIRSVSRKVPSAIVRPDKGPLPSYTLPGGMRLTILSPGNAQLKDLATVWRKELQRFKNRNSHQTLAGKPKPGPLTGAGQRRPIDQAQGRLIWNLPAIHERPECRPRNALRGSAWLRGWKAVLSLSGRRLLIAAAALFAAGLLAFYVLWWGPGPKPGPHVVTIQEGATVGSVARKLAAEGAIPGTAKTFYVMARLFGSQSPLSASAARALVPAISTAHSATGSMRTLAWP